MMICSLQSRQEKKQTTLKGAIFMARKYSESELLQFILLYLEGNSHQTLVNNYNLKLSRWNKI